MKRALLWILMIAVVAGILWTTQTFAEELTKSTESATKVSEPTRIEVLQKEMADLRAALDLEQRNEVERQQKAAQIQNEIVAKILMKRGAIEEAGKGINPDVKHSKEKNAKDN